MDKFFNALRQNCKKEEVTKKVTEMIEGKIQYFKDLDGDKDNMEEMFKEDLNDYMKIIECIFDEETPIEIVEDKYNAMDTAPRETFYCLLEDMATPNISLFNHCTAIDSVKRVMMDKGYDIKEEYFANVGVIHLTFSKDKYTKTSTFHKTNYTKSNVLEFCIDILSEDK